MACVIESDKPPRGDSPHSVPRRETRASGGQSGGVAKKIPLVAKKAELAGRIGVPCSSAESQVIGE
ncbi:hypothetical protein IFM47457_07338 [Aspergillus lentulus]|nr:hypothetical protein IFM47457_07338 [Aspergillus lentulus]